MSTIQNGQIHSNNSSAVRDKLFECVRPFCGVGVKTVKGMRSKGKNSLAQFKVRLLRSRRFLPNQNFPQLCLKKYHHLFGWFLEMKISGF